jgi:hypothetical protein
MRAYRTLAVFLALIVGGALTANAAVKTEEKTQMKFGGVMGKMIGMFGGKATDEGITQVVVVKGNRKLTRADNTGQLIDLDAEKVYDIDFKGKSYRVTTFEEMRQKIREAQEKMRQEMEKMKGNPAATEAPPENQMEFDFSVKESGQRKNILGYDAKEVILTLGIHQKGQKIEDAGGMVTTSTMWLVPRVPAIQEIAEFDMKYFKALATAMDLQQMQQMMGAMAANPYFKNAMERMKDEASKLDGTALLTTINFEMVASKEAQAQQAQAQKEESNVDIPVGGGAKSIVGGIFGGLAKKAIQKKAEEPNPNATPGRSLFMTSTSQMMKIATEVNDNEVSLPAGFKEKN